MHPVENWNQITRENSENEIVSSMFEASLKSSETIETFSSWTLVATAAVASFVLANAEKINPYTGKQGFIVCGLLLCLSCIFGLFSKFFALRCKISNDTSNAVRVSLEEHLKKYDAEEEEIQNVAQENGVAIETGIRIERVLGLYLAAFPRWVERSAKKHFEKHKDNPHIGYITQIKSLCAQSVAMFIQAILFIGFFGMAFMYASKL